MLFEKIDGGDMNEDWLPKEAEPVDDVPEFSEEFSDEEIEKEFVSMKSRSKRGDRRKEDLKKARRKARIYKSKSFDGYMLYDNLHQYSKNKIHCSCRLCRGKDYFGRHITTEQEIKSADEMTVELAEILDEEKGA